MDNIQDNVPPKKSGFKSPPRKRKFVRNIRTGAQQKTPRVAEAQPPPAGAAVQEQELDGHHHLNPRQRGAARKVTQAELKSALQSAKSKLKSAISTKDPAISSRDAAERRKNMAEDRAAAASAAVKVARQVARETKAAGEGCKK
jgi:hypothetical protein